MVSTKPGRKKRAARVLATVLAACMVLMLMSYLFMLSGGSGAAAFVAVSYAAELDGDESASERYEFLGDLIEFVHENYADRLSYDELVTAAYEGLFDSLDEYSEYYPGGEGANALPEALASEYSGVGVSINESKEGVYIVSVNPEGPAHAAGVPEHSRVTAVDGVSMKGRSAQDVMKALRGEEGSAVSLTVEYEGAEKSYRLIRKKLSIHSVSGEMLEGDIAYIDIADMAEKTASEFADARMRLLAEGARGMIIDLRGNIGGYIKQAEMIAEMLLDSGVITIYVKQGEEIERVEASADSTKKLPIVVLTDQHTASAAELLAAALHDNGAAKTVGTATYGKGLGQNIFSLRNGDSIKLSTIHFLSPKGADFNGKGIKPDYLVFNSGTLTEEGRAYVQENVIPLDTERRYFAGQTGLNVLAAQQRLMLLGYELTPNGRMDGSTVEALKALQSQAGGKPYGGLDIFTLKALAAAYDSLVGATEGDAQLLKALDLLK